MKTARKIRKPVDKESLRPRRDKGQAARFPISAAASFEDLVLCLAIALSTLVAYWPALRGELIWDDSSHVTSASLQSLHGLWRIWFKLGATQQYYPLLHSTFWIEHRLWGDAVLGYHLANLTEHIVAACLLVVIVRRLALPGAWLAGMIFALHPVCVESVAWISEQKSTLSAVFYLASALTYLSFDQSRRWSRYVCALGWFVLALMTKSVTATLPAVLLVVFWWQRGKIDLRRDARPLLPWFVIGAAAGLFTAWVEKTYIGAEGSEFKLTWAQHLLLAGRILGFYLSKLLWPVNLIFSYPRWQVDPRVWWQYLYPLGVIALVIVLWRMPRRGPLAGFLIFGGTLFPVLGFLGVFPFRYSYVADHFQYLASLGIIVPMACALMLATLRILPRRQAYAALLIVPAVLGVLTWRQSRMYRDAETIYRTTIERNPESWWAHHNLGGVLSQMPGRQEEAIAEYETTLRIKPDYAKAHDGLGYLYSRMPGRLSDAIAQYQEALRIQPDYAPAHNNLGIALIQLPDRLPDAISEFQTAVRIEPDYVHAHMNLANALAQTPGRMQDAIAEYRATLRIQPDFVPAYMNLGNVLLQAPGQSAEAVDAFEAALNIQPKDARIHNGLGYAYAQMPDHLAEAIAEFQAALRLQPGYLEAHINLGDTLARVPGRRQEAISEYESILQARPDLEVVRESLNRLKSQ